MHPDPDSGRSGRIQRGLAAVYGVVPEPAAVLIHPCDIPLLSGDAVHQLLQPWRQAAAPETLAARLVTPGGRGGQPLRLGRERFAEIRGRGLAQPLRELLRSRPDALLDVPRRSDQDPFLDVDTPEQL